MCWLSIIANNRTHFDLPSGCSPIPVRNESGIITELTFNPYGSLFFRLRSSVFKIFIYKNLQSGRLYDMREVASSNLISSVTAQFGTSQSQRIPRYVRFVHGNKTGPLLRQSIYRALPGRILRDSGIFCHRCCN